MNRRIHSDPALNRMDQIDLPGSIHNKLLSVRRRKTLFAVASTLFAAAACLLVLASVAMFIDWRLAPADRGVRLLLKWLPVGCAVGILIYGWVRYVAPGRNLADVARDVDANVPELDERWSTLVGSHNEEATGWTAAMRNQVRIESTVLEPLVEPQQIVHARWVKYAVMTMAVALLAFLGFFVTHWPWSPTLLHRFLLPTSDVSLTKLECPTEDTVAPLGEPLELSAMIRGRHPDAARVTIRRQDGEQTVIPLEPQPSEADEEALEIVHRLLEPKESFRYQLAAGDGASPWYGVEIVERPTIQDVELQVLTPTGEPLQQRTELPKRIRVHEGNILQVAFRPTAPLQSLDLKLGAGKEHALSRDEDGWYRFETQLTQPLQLSPRLTDTHGFTNRKTHFCRVEVVPDRPPVVAVTAPSKKATDVTPDGVLDIDFVARDDHGIAKAQLIVYDESQLDPEGNPFALHIIDLDLGDQQDAKQVEQQIQLKMSDLGLDPDADVSVGIRVFDLKATAAKPTRTEPRGNATDTISPTQDAVANSSDRSPAETSNKNHPTEATPGRQADPRETVDKTKDSTNSSDTSTEENRPDPSLQASDETSTSPSKPTDRRQMRDDAEKPSQQDATADRPKPSDVSSNDTAESRSNNDSARQRDSTDRPNAGSQDTARKMDSPSQNRAQVGPRRTARIDRQPNRTADQIGQRTDSSRISIVIDENADRFDGKMQQELRSKIEQNLAEIESSIQTAKALSEQALSNLQEPNSRANENLLRQADEELGEVEQRVGDLQDTTAKSEYERSGQDMVDMAQANITPARELIMTSIDSQSSEDLAEAIRLLNEAQASLRQINDDYNQTKMDQQLADSIHKIQKMYAIYVNEAFDLLSGPSAPTASRKPIEYDLDDEYLKRLAEIYEMRMELMAEFARMLASDPRLMSRYADFLQRRTENLMSRLATLVDRQTSLRNEGRAWRRLQGAVRQRFIQLIAYRRLDNATTIVRDVQELQDRFQAQLPLNLDLDQQDVSACQELLANMVTSATTLPPAKRPAGRDLDFADEEKLRSKQATAEEIQEQLSRLERLLVRIDRANSDDGLRQFVELRLTETQELADQITTWTSRIEPLVEQNYDGVAEIDQHALYIDTNQYAGRIADLDTLLGGLFDGNGMSIPEDITEKSAKLQELIIDQAVMHQLAAVFAWRKSDAAEAGQQQEQALTALKQADRLLREIIQQVAHELDKLPAGPPPDLQDPRLEDLLAMLEQELNLEDELGIPPRPNNIMVINPFTRGGGQQMSIMTRQTSRNQRRLGRLMRRILANEAARNRQQKPRSRDDVRWNTLVSQLEDQLRQQRGDSPPEEYRQAIEQYFDQISKLVAEPTSESSE